MRILIDKINDIETYGEFYGPIVSKLKDKHDSIILSSNIKISKESGIQIVQGIQIGIKEFTDTKTAFCRKVKKLFLEESIIEFIFEIPNYSMEELERTQIEMVKFPFCLTFLYTSLLFYNDYKACINHLDFMKEEIIDNPIALTRNGIIIADRIVISGIMSSTLTFYNAVIIGRNEDDALNLSYELLISIETSMIRHIIIVGREDCGFNRYSMILRSPEDIEVIKQKIAEERKRV